jgi:hypothetical protein
VLTKGSTALPASLLLIGAIGGCADPYVTTPKARPPAPGEQPGRPAEATERAPDPRVLARTPERAARRAVLLTGTWTAQNAAVGQKRLATMSVGQARRDALQAAARLPTDPQLAAGHATSTASFAAIVLHGTGRSRSGLVVTHERLTVNGASHERWRVTLVTVVRLDGGWAISRWQPQE